jgi:hypothetical protein
MPADVIVRPLHPIECAHHDGCILSMCRHHCGWLEKLKEALHDHTLKELVKKCMTGMIVIEFKFFYN